jgi:hypothetical protein
MPIELATIQDIQLLYSKIDELKALILSTHRAEQPTLGGTGLLSVPEVAKRAGISIKTLKMDIEKGLIIPHDSTRKQLRFSPREVERYINRGSESLPAKPTKYSSFITKHAKL